MTTVYPMPFFPANPRPPRPRLRGLGTLHVSAQWTANVRAIRAAVAAAREAAPGQRAPSAERLADEVIDCVDRLTAVDRAVLAVTLGILLRPSKN